MGSVDLGLELLHSMHAVSSNVNKDATAYDRQGMDKSRIKHAVKQPRCKCQCTAPFQIVLKVCVAFWMLTKAGQDTVLWNIQHSQPGDRKEWYIAGLIVNAQTTAHQISSIQLYNNLEGQHVCKVAWLYMMGIGRQRLQRCKKMWNGKDGRSLRGFFFEIFSVYTDTCLGPSINLAPVI